MNSLTDLVNSLKAIDADRLVDLLRSMHNSGVRPDWANAARAFAPSPSPSPETRSRSMPESPRRGFPEPSQDEERGYFVDLERRLRRQQDTTDAVIGRLRSRERGRDSGVHSTSPPQQLVAIVALEGTLAGGRFVVAHDGEVPVRVEFRVGELRDSQGRIVESAASLEPAVFDLGPSARRIVSVRFDLGNFRCAERRRLVSSIEAVTTAGAVLAKIVVEVDVHPEDLRAGA